MLIAILQFELLIHGAESLKDKRRIVASLKDRLHRHHMASVAETGLQDSLRAARMGVAVVGSDALHLAGVLDRITDRIRTHSHEAELGDTFREIISNGLGANVEDEPQERERRDEDLEAELLARIPESPRP
ncbi:MAG: DUF503 domain-containing protein [Phycisphaerae bacterium]|jgi:uncharacterized protein YlxP (DUF503 family)